MQVEETVMFKGFLKILDTVKVKDLRDDDTKDGVFKLFFESGEVLVFAKDIEHALYYTDTISDPYSIKKIEIHDIHKIHGLAIGCDDEYEVNMDYSKIDILGEGE